MTIHKRCDRQHISNNRKRLLIAYIFTVSPFNWVVLSRLENGALAQNWLRTLCQYHFKYAFFFFSFLFNPTQVFYVFGSFVFAAGRKAAWLVKCCFPCTETVVFIIGTGAQPDVHHDFHTAPELWERPLRKTWLIWTWSSWETCTNMHT